MTGPLGEQNPAYTVPRGSGRKRSFPLLQPLEATTLDTLCQCFWNLIFYCYTFGPVEGSNGPSIKSNEIFFGCMSHIEFNAQEISALRLHFSEEKARLESQLTHVDLMLDKLGGAVAVKRAKTPGLTAAGAPPKKRGPKSIWGAFIVKRLRARNRPMSYEELIEEAMTIHKIEENKRNSAKASILNSAFRLRTVHGKVVSVGRPGKKEKMLALTKWLEHDGSLKQEYAKEFKSIMGGKAERVDMAAIPVSPYEESED